MEGELCDYQQQFHTGKVLGGEILSMLASTIVPPQYNSTRVLDLGCGDGVLGLRLSQELCPGIKCDGVDADPNFVEAATSAGFNARVGDGHTLADFPNASYDRVFSNAALHWMSRDPAAVAASVYRVLVPGGIFVSESGGYGNVDTVVRALETQLQTHGVDSSGRNPWYFPKPEQHASMLRAAGFEVDLCDLVPKPTPLGCDMLGWLKTFGGVWLRGLPEVVADRIRKSTRDQLEKSHLYNSVTAGEDGVAWTIDYVRIRVVARKPLHK